MKILGNKKIVLFTVIAITITALIGGFLLSTKEETEPDDFENADNQSEVQDYTNLITQDEEEEKELSVINDNEDNSDEEKTVEQEVEEAKQNISDVDSNDYEDGVDLYDVHEKEYSKKQIDNAIKQTYEVIYLFSNTSNSEELVQEKWNEITTNDLFEKITSGQKESISIRGYKEIELVPIESDYDGISVGLFVATESDVALFEFNYKMEKNKALLDDFKILWSS